MYQRALNTLLKLRKEKLRNDPEPEPEVPQDVENENCETTQNPLPHTLPMTPWEALTHHTRQKPAPTPTLDTAAHPVTIPIGEQMAKVLSLARPLSPSHPYRPELPHPPPGSHLGDSRRPLRGPYCTRPLHACNCNNLWRNSGTHRRLRCLRSSLRPQRWNGPRKAAVGPMRPPARSRFKGHGPGPAQQRVGCVVSTSATSRPPPCSAYPRPIGIVFSAR